MALDCFFIFFLCSYFVYRDHRYVHCSRQKSSLTSVGLLFFSSVGYCVSVKTAFEPATTLAKPLSKITHCALVMYQHSPFRCLFSLVLFYFQQSSPLCYLRLAIRHELDSLQVAVGSKNASCLISVKTLKQSREFRRAATSFHSVWPGFDEQRSTVFANTTHLAWRAVIGGAVKPEEGKAEVVFKQQFSGSLPERCSWTPVRGKLFIYCECFLQCVKSCCYSHAHQFGMCCCLELWTGRW